MWVQSKIAVGDIVNIRTSRWEDAFIVDTECGFIVINPDYLITCTGIASSLFCPRKAWLNEKFRGWGAGNDVMLVGTIVHELLQECTLKKIYEESKIYHLMHEILQNVSFMVEAFSCGMTQQSLRQRVADYVPWIREFIEMYILGEPSELYESPRTKLKILEVLDIEDNIWCRYFGVKGKVDFTVKVKIFGSDFSVRNRVLPMELKTGKVSTGPEHSAQATLYTLMMDNRHYGSCDSALLLYLKEGPKLKQVTLPDSAKHTLIQRRNDYEYMMRKWSDGPEFKDCDRICPNCEHVIDCSLMAKNFEEDKFFDTNVQETIANNALAHLSGIEIGFFGDWVKKLNRKSDSLKVSSDFWNTPPQIREEAGTSLGKMIISSHKKFTYTFTRHPKFEKDMKQLNESLKSLHGRERVALSLDETENLLRERDMIAVLIGFIEQIETSTIICTFDKALQKDLYGKVFRIDILGRGSYASVIPFSNLHRLMMPEANCARLRQTIILGDPPSFTGALPKIVATEAKTLLADNASKNLRKAIALSLTTSHYLILKCSTFQSELDYILTMLKLVNVWNKRALIISPDSVALDSILLHLVWSKVQNFVRLGSSSKLDSQLEDFSAQIKMTKVTSISEFQAIYEGNHIASTFYSLANSPAYENSPEDFEFCIIDQADRVSLPIALGPLFRSKRFILINSITEPPLQPSDSSGDSTSSQTSMDTDQVTSPKPLEKVEIDLLTHLQPITQLVEC